MRILLIILLLLLGCNDPDSPFNPNKNKILAKEKKECIRDTLALYISGLKNPKYFIDGDCDDPNSIRRKENPDLTQCKGQALQGFEFLIAARLISCPKGLAED